MSDALYDFELPDDRIARHPRAERDDARLLWLHAGGREDRTVRELPLLLRAGDVLVVNDTRVVPARVHARRATGGAVELLFVSFAGTEGRALVRPSRRLRRGESLDVASGAVVVLGDPHEDGEWSVHVPHGVQQLLDGHGHVPLPPYLGRDDDADDRVRYQTVYAQHPGSVAAPTAGLHFTPDLLARLEAVGVVVARVTLHVGPGTFRPPTPAQLAAGTLHAERYVLPDATADAIAAARARKGRVVAVGTTSARTLETCARADGTVRAGEGTTTLFLREGSPIRVVDVLMTNFHLPRSSLVMLVCAFGGANRVMDAYRHAIREGYSFYSYGDAMLVERA